MKAVVILIFFFSSLVGLAQNTFSVEELTGKINPSTNEAFVKIDKAYTDKPSIFLRREAYDSFVRMARAAEAEGIEFKIISATRNFNYQKGIWEKKWARKKYMGWQDFEKAKDIMTYSSMPGTSRHHWGTDIDLNSLNNDWFESGEGKHIYSWLIENAATYGFYQVYTSKNSGRTGYNEEKWHWSYLPISKTMLLEYNTKIAYPAIAGFSGSEAAEKIKAIEEYVNGVNEAVKP